MLIRCGYTISFAATAPTPLMAMLSLHPSRNRDLQTPPRLMTTPDVPIYDYVDAFGNTCTRMIIPEGGITLSCDFIVADSGLPDRQSPDAVQHPVADLPDDILVYLLGSRYCETDRLSDTAWNLFGHIAPGWDRVEAIVAWVHYRIKFGYPNARATRTAWDAHQEQVGVCRDFAHLAVTLCRCMNIPARYCTGYLGDIRIEPIPGPMDFSAWFDVYLGGEWHSFDARHNYPRIGRVLMARGRDATDTALTTAFGPTTLTRFDVHADEVASERTEL